MTGYFRDGSTLRGSTSDASSVTPPPTSMVKNSIGGDMSGATFAASAVLSASVRTAR